ncbi:non-ribosomal peptide synthetase [Nocardia sp. CDC159]|uniref:Non-ribosomal peptide synthetase n=1 Tax=Nocardia pulmonis TaxID=2951408 RepID=A0A9X2ECQ0_9NOCA|nr:MULTISPECIES: non-ribosomal peptide synthetase [Nocardia]MCM6778424.1 non-ribosomal peptide synthetase [Nocardia pulmonis]MCM6791313.1 non-ribosomal peptide synthetase [Nocardia sp. CDC159]
MVMHDHNRSSAAGWAGAWARDAAGRGVVELDPWMRPRVDRVEIERAVSRATSPFLVGEHDGSGGLVAVSIGDETPGSAAAVEVHLRVDEGAVSAIEVRGRHGEFRLDDLVAKSLAASVARQLGVDVPRPAGPPETAAAEVADIVTRVFEVAERDPDRVAVRVGDDTLTFGALVARARRYAAVLDDEGAAEVVAVPYRRVVDTVVVLLGVLVSRRAYLLLSETDATDYNAEVMRWTGATRAPVEPVGAEDRPAPWRPATGAAAAYVSFTSGTTGSPKAIVIEHAQLSAYCRFLSETGICGPDVVMPALSAPGFDAIVKQIWGQLSVGGAVRIPTTDDPVHEIEKALRIDGVTINTVPTVWREILDLLPTEAFPESGVLLLGGEALDVTLIERTLRRWPGVRIVNLYGPSECTSNATWLHDCGTDRDVAPIGRAVHGSFTHVLDSALRPVPVGGVGELYVSGACVGRGYHADPGRTARSFLPSVGAAPGCRPGDRMYATGDLVRQTSAGLVFLGRSDMQRKVNGVRVDLEALRADLSAVPGVRAAAVDTAGGSIDIFIVPTGPDVVSAVQTYVRRTWRVEIGVGHIWAVDALPRHASGKVDLTALRRLVSAPVAAADGANTDASHRVLEIIWSNVLGSPARSRDTSLADLGGDSMKRLKLIALYRRILEVDVSIDDFRDRDTLGDHEDVLLQRVDRDKLDALVSTLESAR